MNRHGRMRGRWPRRVEQCSAVAIAAVLACAQGDASAALFTGMGSLPIRDSTISSISDAGVVYGLGAMFGAGPSPFYETPASYRFGFSWSTANPSQTTFIDTLERGANGGLIAMSANGVGAGFDSAGGFGARAAVWSGAGPVLVGPASGMSMATAVSADGRRVAGVDFSGGSTFITPSGFTAGYSTLPGGGQPPGPFPAATFTPSRLSSDGLAVVGTTASLFGPRQLSGYLLSDLTAGATWQSVSINAGQDALAVAVSSVGGGGNAAMTVAGNATWQGQSQAFVFQQGVGGFGAITRLGVLDPVYEAGVLQPYNASQATAMSADGNLVLGTSSSASGRVTPFFWTRDGGMKPLDTILANSGTDLTGWQLQSVTAVSQNGQYIGGLGLHNGQAETWVANLLPRLLYSDAQAATVSFGAIDSWRDRVGASVAALPGPQDDVVLQAAGQFQQVGLQLAPQTVLQSLDLARGVYELRGLSGDSLTVTETLSIRNGVSLSIWGTTAVTAKRLVVGGSREGGRLLIGRNDADSNTSLTLQSTEIVAGSRVEQLLGSTLTTGTLVVGGVYTSAMKYAVLGIPAGLSADRIEVSGSGSVAVGGAVSARSIRNAGTFEWRGEDLVVGSGRPAADPLDAFLNTGTLVMRPQGNFQYLPRFRWVGNVTNAKHGTVKTYGVAGVAAPTIIDWGTGTFTNKGSYISDPAVNIFGTLVVADDGVLSGGAGDAFQVRGDFTDTSTGQEWDVGQATLSFVGTGPHTYRSSNSTTWGALQLDAGVQLALKATGTGPVSFSFAALAGFSSLADLQARLSVDSGITIQVASIAGGWDPGGTITLPGGGRLISAVPEPGTSALWLAGLLAVCGQVRRRSRP